MFKAKIIQHEDFSKDQLKIARQSLKKLDEIFNSKKFKSQIINYICPITGKKKFLLNNKLSNQKIYDKLVDGAEFSICLDDYKAKKGKIGYTYPSDKTI